MMAKQVINPQLAGPTSTSVTSTSYIQQPGVVAQPAMAYQQQPVVYQQPPVVYQPGLAYPPGAVPYSRINTAGVSFATQINIMAAKYGLDVNDGGVLLIATTVLTVMFLMVFWMLFRR
jgi:hypothetical protein